MNKKPDWAAIQEKSKGKKKTSPGRLEPTGKVRLEPTGKVEPPAGKKPKGVVVPKVAARPRDIVVGGVTQGRTPIRLANRLDYLDKPLASLGVGPGVKKRAS